MQTPSINRLRAAARALVPCLAALLAAPAAQASFLSGDALAKAADVLAIVILVVVPITAIVVFWLVHVLPEKIAHKRHHPQKDAIQVLCLLSLVFGGLLWPLAWLWAYTKPVLYKMAYGTDKSADHLDTPPIAATAATRSVRDEIAGLRAELDMLSARSDSPSELAAVRDRFAALEPRLHVNAEEAR